MRRSAVRPPPRSSARRPQARLSRLARTLDLRLFERKDFALIAEEAASSFGDALTEAIQDRPIAAIAVALGVGFLVGLGWRR